MNQPPVNLESLSREALESLVADLCATNASLEAKHAAIQRSHAIVSEELGEAVAREKAMGRKDHPEGCTLRAVDDCGEYILEVVDRYGNVVAYLDWPESWPEIVSPAYLTIAGFNLVPA